MQNIPTGLQALMQASAVLQNTAAPTAPGPQGQQPTVANRVMQQGMAQAGKQAGIANAMMMQKAQQQQRMAQDPQAVAQMAAQMLKQGVGGLPVNMQFKDGGIIGFDDGGTVRAGVRKTPSPQFDKENQQLILEYLKQLGDMKLMAGLAMQEGNPTIAQLLASKRIGDGEASLGAMGTPSDLQAIMAGYSRPLAGGRVGVNATIPKYSPRDPQFGLSYSKQFADGGIIGFQEGGQPRFGTAEWERLRQEEMERLGIRNPLEAVGEYLRGLVPDKPIGSGAVDRRRKELEAARQDPSMVLSPVLRDTVAPDQEQKPQAGAPVQEFPDGLPREIPSETGAQLGATPVKRDTAGSTPPPAPPQEDVIAALQAQLAGLQVERPVAPTMEQIASQAKGLLPSPETGIERIRKISEDRERAIEGMPNLEREGIAALEEAKAARKALLQKRREDDSYDTLRAFFRGLYTRGNDFDVARMGIKARDEQDSLADLNHANSILKLRQAEQARQLGKFDRQEALEREALSQMDKYSDNVAKSMQVTGTLLANVYNTDAQSVSQTLNRQAQQLIELAKLKQQYEQQNDTRQVQRITALQGQLTNALRNVNSKVDEKYKTLLMIVNGPGGAQAIDKDQNLQKQLGDYRKELETARAEFNIPQLEQVLQSEISRYTGVQSNVLLFDRSGNRTQ